jgi:hypothetical protein
VVRDNLLSKTLSLIRRKNKVKTSLLAKVLVSLTGYENKVKLRASLLANTLDSLAKVEYVFVASKV